MAGRYVRSKTIHLFWDCAGFLKAESSISRATSILERSDLDILDFFSTPRAIEEVLERFSESLCKEGMRNKISMFLERGLLLEESEGEELAADNFGLLSQHVTMLNDHARVDAYARAISQVVREGDVVVDLGCGTGILGIIALLRGASFVHAIEESAVLNIARELYKINGLGEKVRFFPGNSLNAELPERCDLLVSELFGTDPLAEGMLKTLCDAGKRFLKPGGRMIPEEIKVFARAIETRGAKLLRENRESHVEGLKHFHRLFGVRVEPLMKRLLNEPLPTFTVDLGQALRKERSDARFISEDVMLEAIDLKQLKNDHISGSRSFSINDDGKVDAVAFFFSSMLAGDITLSTSPDREGSLNWGGQTVYVLKKPIEVKKGEKLPFRIYAGPLTKGRLRPYFS